MKKFWMTILVASSFALLLTSCEAVFTASFLTGFQRDPANLKGEALQAYAESLLASGTASQDELAAAYNAIKKDASTSTDPDLQLLAADLALGASGLNTAIDTTLQNIDAILAGTSSVDPFAELAGLDLTLLEDSAALVAAAASNGASSLTGTQAIVGAAGALVAAANAVSSPTPAYTIQNLLQLAAGESNATLTNLSTDLGGADYTDTQTLLAAGGLPTDFFSGL